VLHPVRAEQFIHRKADSHRAGITHRIFGIFDQFAEEAHAVFERTAIFIGAVIVF
jgi:hypothetical protein